MAIVLGSAYLPVSKRQMASTCPSTQLLLPCRPVVQNPQERAQAEQMLKVFGLSTEYVPHCKV